MKKMNNKNLNPMRRLMTLMAVVFALSATAHAQVFLLDEDSPRSGSSGEDVNAIIPIHFEQFDQENDDLFVPVGSGTLLLTGLCLGYGIAKKKK